MKPACRFWAKGGCRDGDQCRFSHEGQQRASPPRPVCKYWKEKGSCREGAKCRFSHDAPRGVPPARPCEFWARGSCRDGDQCRFSHQGPKGNPLVERETNEGDRRLFDKFTKKAAPFDSPATAERFAKAMEEYSDGDLPWRLTRRDEFGLKRIMETFMVGRVKAVLPIIRAFARREWKEARFADALQDCWHELYAGRGVIEGITNALCGRPCGRPLCESCEIQNLDALAEMAMSMIQGERPEEQNAETLQRLVEEVMETCGMRPDAQNAKRRAARCVQLLQGAQVPSPRAAAKREQHPGGRNSNDHTDFRRIGVVPTLDEAVCEKAPFLPRSEDESFLNEDPETQLLDRQFRLLREDMLAPLREHVSNGSGEKLPVKMLQFDYQERRVEWVENRKGEEERRIITSPGPIGILFLLESRMDPAKFVEALQQRGQLRQGNLVLLQTLSKDSPATNVEFARVVRLALSDNMQAELCLSFTDPLKMLNFRNESLQVLLVRGSFFAYEPVLHCLQSKRQLQFQEEMLLKIEQSPRPDYHGAERLYEQIQEQLNRAEVNIDEAQLAAFRHATEHRVALIVGPPGTGKSFVAVEMALAVLRVTDLTLLVVCYTNHALDDFLGKLLERGIDKIVRIGGRSKDTRLEPFALRNLAHSSGLQGGTADRRRIYELKKSQEELRNTMRRATEILDVTALRWNTVQRIIKEVEHDQPYRLLDALSLPGHRGHDDSDVESDPEYPNGFSLVGKHGKQLRPDHLWKAWQEGRGPEPFLDRANQAPWTWSLEKRTSKVIEWLEYFKEDAVEEFETARKHYDRLDAQLSELHRASERAVLRDARVVGATTTGAAKYRSLIEAADIGFALMEEAGEVLEAHVHTSLSESTKHVVMIGDHRQLRPKVEAHALTVAAGNGYNLNRSLFERLILGGLPHAELKVQHRMRPEISSIARHMTYPMLEDGEGVAQRPHMQGLAGNVVFVSHSKLEQGADDEVFGGSLSKINMHEAELSVQIVGFLLAQGYRADDLVVLTPYLGQLKQIKTSLRKAKLDTVIGDKDIEDLITMGDTTQPWHEEVGQLRAVRVSTVDNYQGEEANIVIASLVRSNTAGQLGFLGKADAEQRVNVLCTRARCGLIIIGNSSCLEKSPLWQKLLKFLRERGCMYDGLPVKCQRHGTLLEPSTLQSPSELEQLVKRGAGCESRCDTILDCGHACPHHCHPFPHDQVRCPHKVPTLCRANLHHTSRACCERSPPNCQARVVDQCERAHPIVRRCFQVGVRCRMCAVLKAGDENENKLAAEFAEEKIRLLEQVVNETCHKGGPRKKEVHQNDAVEQIKKLADDLLRQQDELDFNLGNQIAEAEAQTQAEMEGARRAQLEQRAKFERELVARQAQTREQIHRVAEQMEQSRAEAKAEAEAEIRQRDERLQHLHDTLVNDLQSTEKELRQAAAARPSQNDVEKNLEDVRKMAPVQTCAICMDESTVLDGILCQAVGVGHFVCKICFGAHVKNEAERQEFSGDIRCPYSSRALGGCTSQPYKDCLISRLVPEAFDVYFKAKLKLREAAIAAEMQRDYEKRLADARAEMAAASRDAKVKEARDHIIEKILTLLCPRCQQAFIDFSGCFALTCSRQACGCAFCAHCLKDCDSDAHGCAAECGRPRGMDVFGALKDFESIQKERRRNLVQAYLNEFNGEMRNAIISACERELKDLGIH